MKQRTIGSKIFDIFNIAFMIMLTLIFLIPFLTVLSTSFVSDAESTARGAYQLIPHSFDFNCYQVLLSSGSSIYRAYGITIFRTVFGTAFSLLLTVMLAYGLSKKALPYRKQITFFVFFPMLFNGGMVPTYLLVHSIGIYNTIWAMILPCAVSVWNTILMRNFFAQIPDSLEESAKIDGASTLCILFRIILPVSLPSIATIGLFYAVSHWNAWFDAALYINTNNLYPLQLILRNIVMAMSNADINNAALNNLATAPPSESMKCAAIVVTTVPIMCVYPFIQKYFVKGVMVGSVKG